MTVNYRPRYVSTITGTPGTGDVTLSSAVATYQTWVAGDDGLLFDVTFVDGSNWETYVGLQYSNSGTKLLRGAATPEASSAGGTTKNSLTSATIATLTPSATKFASIEATLSTYIRGLVVTKHSGANTLDISSGACYDPSSGQVIAYAGGSGVSAGSLGASQWNQVYIYLNSGTATIQVVNNAAPPPSTYAGNARQGGGGNGRWIGCFLTDGSSNIVQAQSTESATGQITHTWQDDALIPGAFRVANNLTGTSYAANGNISLATAVPAYIATEALFQLLLGLTTTAPGQVYVYISADGTNQIATTDFYINRTGYYIQQTLWCPINSTTPSFWALVNIDGSGVGQSLHVQCLAFKYVR